MSQGSSSVEDETGGASRSHPSQGHEEEVRSLARGGGLNLLGAAFNQTLRFAVTLVLAHLLGPTEAGLFYEVFAVFAFLGLFAAGGLSPAVTRFVALHRVDEDPAALVGTVRMGLVASTGAALLIGALLFAAAPMLATGVFHQPRLVTPLRLVALALPPTVLTDVALAATRGFKTMRPYALINLFFEPSVRIVLTVALIALGLGLEGAVAALLFTNAVAALVAVAVLRRMMPASPRTPTYIVREMFGFSFRGWISNLTDSALLWADVVLLGILRGPTEVGIYVVATRLTLLSTIFVGPISTSFAPSVADLWRRGLQDGLRKTYALVTSWIVRLALPGAIVLILFPEPLLSLFGPGFSAGARATVILACAQLFNMATGPCGDMLLMSGHATLVMVTDVASLVLNLALNLWLIPRFGIAGAAMAWAGEIFVMNGVRLVQVWRVMGMAPLGAGMGKGLVAGAAAITAVLGVRSLTSGVAGLVLGGSLTALVYVATLLLLGLADDDRLVLGTLWRRAGLRNV